jgi:tRNA (cmo5U34)-methyltransferase
MATQGKSSVEEIRQRFDGDVERFSNLETGHAATMDSLMVLDLVPRVVARMAPAGTRGLDIGCGAGNYTLKLAEHLPGLAEVTLMDLSLPMLERARQRVEGAGVERVGMVQKDVREADLGEGVFDVVLAASVLHHLRTREEWRNVLKKVYLSLAPGGVLGVFDLIRHENSVVQEVMVERYREYLIGLGGKAYQEKVFAYVEREDTPWALSDQLALLGEAGFREVEVLHKNGLFAAWVARK